jgi:DNA-directed RNA polymerase subunit M/transcription elongation factor TFIIS
MEALSKQMFQTHGLSEQDAFVLAGMLKYDATNDGLRVFPSQKHADSAFNHGWMDRVLNAVAKLQVREQAGKMEPSFTISNAELEAMTGHTALLNQIQEEDKRIEELLASGRKERAEGFLKCNKCQSKEVDVEQKQTRSADEPMTLFALCTKCGTRWTMK